MNFIKIENTDNDIIYVNTKHIAYIQEFTDYTKIELITGKIIATKQRYVTIEKLLNK